ncbi:MAG: bacterioferritin [Bradymonadales bacterium]|nr:bacterioferritin [Bradymonadales bacterium]
MKGNDQIIEVLNSLLADELTAINQYMVHSEMCEDWGYTKLHEAVEKRAIDEMKHAEKLIGRLLYLEGTPIVSQLNPIHIGDKVDKQFENDMQSEVEAIEAYNKAITLASSVGDHGTKELLTSILQEEEDHIDWLETQLDQISHMGLGVYLTEQV